MFAEVSQVRIEMRSYWSRMGPKSNNWRHYKRHRRTRMHRKEGRVKVEAGLETSQEPPGAIKGRILP